MSKVALNQAFLPKAASPSPFEALAHDYDASFTQTPIGRLLRQAVWRRLDARFSPGDRILELNCGTGEDAIYLAKRGCRVVATDTAVAMLRATQTKVACAGLQDRVFVRQMELEALECAPLFPPAPGTEEERQGGESQRFEGALSNFGGLNCVADWQGVATGLAASLRPGAFAVLCVMGPCCAWEWAWYLRQGNPRKAFRRLRRGGVPWRGLTIRYPTIGVLRRAFAPSFRLVRTTAIGAFVPPTYAGEWAARHPHLLGTLNAWERRLDTIAPLPALADHYLLELERVGDAGDNTAPASTPLSERTRSDPCVEADQPERARP